MIPSRTRPTLREPHPVRPWAVVAGALGAGVWLLSFGMFGVTLGGYVGWTVLAGLLAWLAALALIRYGDRGVAAGVAAATGVAWTAAALSVIAEWIRRGAWPL
ncbi:hypothetical protein Cme02nite_23440 [Catellatospora methionotrophica]|uniref:Uncharacterized protein n=1 Tax=Catellatospora methionotrophica TaxID=121620 RepID=A0A8J3PED1_9ACTN|nr:hypothetical protein [Catellatospora methionotrophica]GIG14012.1 hypothetical protein Cme02nite_23440 [Catellatospora methionotrophica]